MVVLTADVFQYFIKKKRTMFGIIPSDELELSSVLGDTRAYLYRLVPFGGSYSEPKGNSS